MPNPHSLPLLAAALVGFAILAGLVFAWLRLGKRLPDWARWGAAAFLAFNGLAYLLVAYAALIEPEMLVVRRIEIVSANWHGAPLTIAAIGDTHVGGPHMDAARMARVVRQINALHPDLVVLLGDYAYGHRPETARTPAERQEIVGALATAAAFDSRYGVVAVLGNHDGWYGRESIIAALQSAGAAALWNRNVVIHRSGGEIVIAGLADAWTGHPDFAEALDGAPPGDDIIVLSHNPDPFAQMPPGIALMLAGHTHCGQVTIPFIGRPFLPIRHKEYACHLIEQRGEALYVTAGVGTSVAPLRFLNPPEISLITVRGVGAH